jgi:hypothetical protein
MLCKHAKTTDGSSSLDRRLPDQSSDGRDVRVCSGHGVGGDHDRQAHRSRGLENRSVSCSGRLPVVVPLSRGLEIIRVGLQGRRDGLSLRSSLGIPKPGKIVGVEDGCPSSDQRPFESERIASSRACRRDGRENKWIFKDGTKALEDLIMG